MTGYARVSERGDAPANGGPPCPARADETRSCSQGRHSCPSGPAAVKGSPRRVGRVTGPVARHWGADSQDSARVAYPLPSGLTSPLERTPREESGLTKRARRDGRRTGATGTPDLKLAAPYLPAVVGLATRPKARPHDPVVPARTQPLSLAAVAPAQLEPISRLRGPDREDLASAEQLEVVVVRPGHRCPPKEWRLTGPEERARRRRNEVYGTATGGRGRRGGNWGRPA